MLKFKGMFNTDESYEVNDVVLMETGEAYKLRFPCPSGTPPINTRFWARLSPELSACAQLIVSCILPVVPELVIEPKKTTRKKKEAAE